MRFHLQIPIIVFAALLELATITSAQTTPTPTVNFRGREDTGWIPPDTHGAVGPNHVLSAVNGSVRIKNRTGTVLSTVNLNTFFGRTDTVFDPKFYYDHFSNRWLGAACANGGSPDSAVLIAASRTADPTGLWNFYSYDADASNNQWADYPSCGFNKDWFAVSMNMFSMTNSFGNGRLYLLPRLALYAGGIVTARIFNDTNGFTLVPAVTHDANLATLYVLQNWNGSSGGRGYIRLLSVTGAIGAEQYTEVSRPSTIQTWLNNTASGGNCLPQSGSTNNIHGGDVRMQNAVFRNGSIWGTQTAFAGSGSSTRAFVQWWQISTTGTVQQTGRIEDTSGTFHYAFPSIAVNRNNDALIGFSRCSATTFASAAYAFRASGDAANTMRAPYVFKAGDAAYYKNFGGDRNRWGDYSATMTDPVDDTAFWTTQEHALTNNQWSTWWAQVVPSNTLSTIRFSSASYAVVENGGTATISLTRGGNIRSVVSVNYATGNGSAVAGSDYTSRSGTLTFADNQDTVTFTVPILNDSSPENDETVNLTLSSPSSGGVLGSPSTATLTITDDNDVPPPTVTVGATDSSAREPSDPGTFALSRTGSTAVPLSVIYALSGTATNGSDYSTLSGTATIPAGSSSVTITVAPIDDAAIESTETVILTLSANAAYIIGSPSNATVNLLDDDQTPVVTIQSSDSAAGEPANAGQFTLTRTGSSLAALTVNLTAGGSATNGTDYSTIGSSVTIAAGQSNATVNVSIIDDTLVEGSETVLLSVASGSGYTVGSPSSATVTIAENDNATGNDAFTGRVAFTTLNTTGSNASATKEIGEPNHGGNIGGRSVWWTWTAGFSGSVTFSTAGSNFDTTLGIYTGTSVGALTLVGSNDDFGGGNTSSVTFNAVSGTIYQVAVDGHNGISGNIQLSRTADPTSISTVAISSTDATATEGTADNAVISLTRSAPTTASLVVNLSIGGTALNGIDYQSVGTAYTFPAGVSTGTITLQTLDDAQIELAETATFAIQSNAAYVVGTPSSTTITLNDNDTAVGNDSFSGAAVMTEPSTTGTSVGATKQTGEPNHAGNTGGKSVWWTWTSTFTGPVTFATTGSNFDTLLAIYTGTSVTSLTLVASDNDSGGSLSSRVTFGAVLGTVYRIAVDGVAGAAGNITLTRTGDPQPLPIVSIVASDSTSKEGSGDTGTYVLARTGSTTSSLAVQLAFSGTASNATDYNSLSGSQTIPAGQESINIIVTPVDDTLAEGVESVIGTIVPSAAYSVDDDAAYVPAGRSVATVYISDNDVATNNDAFASRLTLAGNNFSALGSNLNFTKETGEPNHAGNTGGKSSWWTWTAPSSGLFSFNTHGSSFDTTLAVYKGTSVSALTLVASNDDSGGGVSSDVQFNAIEGTPYEIAVDGYNGASGAITLNGQGGTGLPEIVVEQPAGTSLTDAVGSVGFGSVNVGSSGTALTITVRNAGTASLTGLTLTKDGNNAADFTLSSLPVTTLGQSESTTFTITFSPQGAGPRTAAIHLASNDPDESPFDITLSGVGGQIFTRAGTTVGALTWNRPNPGTPPSALSGSATIVPYEAFAFTVTSSGDYLMTSTGTWDNHLFLYSNAFSPSSPLSNVLDGTDPYPNIGQSRITRNLVAGTIYYLVTTGYSNTDQGTYTLSIDGPGVVVSQGGAEIVIEQPTGTSLTDGSSTVNFGTANIGGLGQTLTFVVKNTGVGTLTGISLNVDGAHGSDFLPGVLGTTSLAPGTQTSFTVSVIASGAGTRTAALHVTSNDSDESPFDVFLTATASSEFLRVGNTAAGTLWNRPVAGTPPASLSTSATAVPYEAMAFTVNTSGSYQFTSTATGSWDNYLFLYSGTFSAATPLNNALVGNDDNPNVGVSGFGFNLTAGTSYILVNTGYSNSSSGQYTVSINGPGAVSAQPVDPLWNPNANGNVVSMAFQPDGKIVIGGTFTAIGGVTRNSLARLNSNGTLDTSFNPNVNGEVVDIIVQPDGKIVIGGLFTLVGGTTRAGLARLNTDGTLDASLNLSADSFVYGLTLQPDGKILVSGGFDDIGGVTRNGVARINANGTLDTSFANPQFNNTAACTVVQTDGRIVVGGAFTTAAGVSRQRIARLNSNGTLDASFNPSASDWVFAIAEQPDGKLVIGGTFLTVGGVSRQRIARLGADGSLDTAFNPGANNFVYSITMQADGKLLIGGDFTSVGGQSRQRVARLSNIGQVDSFPNESIDSEVRSVMLREDGQVLVSGNFTNVNGLSRGRLVSLLNTVPSLQSLSIPETNRLSWTRLGSAPEVGQTIFELSTNGGSSWTALGTGTRVSGGWQITSLSLPGSGMVRARGRVIGGNFNGSSGMVEQTASFALGSEIVVHDGPLQSDPDIIDGQTVAISLGSTSVGSPTTKTLLIQNIGTSALTLSSVTKDGVNSADFALGALGSTSVPPGGSTTLGITFTPSASGVRTAAIHLASNDSDESPFDIPLTGSTQSSNTLEQVLTDGSRSFWRAYGSLVDDASLTTQQGQSYDAFDAVGMLTMTPDVILPDLVGNSSAGPLTATASSSNLTVTRNVSLLYGRHATDEVISLTNTAGTSQSVTLAVADNYGSDDSTSVHASSSGDTAVTTADSWFVISDQTTAASTSDDPAVMVSWQFSSTMPTPAFPEVPGAGLDSFRMDFGTFSIPAGQTVTITIRRELFDSASLAIANGSPLTSSRGQLTSPVPGSTLTSTTVPFTWSAGSGATAYWLYLGSSSAASDYFNSGSLGSTVLSQTATGLPSNSSTIYARLWTQTGGTWLFNDYTYTAAPSGGGGSTRGLITSPAAFSALNSTTKTFTWSAGSSATGYWLYAGSSVGGTNYHNSGSLASSVLNRTVTGLPNNGSTVYVRLYSLVGGSWVYDDYTYTASAVAETVTTPNTPSGVTSGFTGTSYTFTTGGSTSNLGGSVQYQFDWGDGTTSAWLAAGTTSATKTWSAPGTFNVRALARSVANTSVVSSLSTALSVSIANAGSTRGIISNPVNGSIFGGTSVTFTWNAGSNATAYWLYVGSSVGSTNYDNSGSLASSVLNRTVTGLPSNSSAVYVRLYSLVSGAWVYDDYTYTASTAVSETVSTPTTPTGTASGASGTSYSYTTGGSTTNLSNPVQYQFDWGDGSNSGWLPVGTTSAAKTWSAGGTYSVRAQARSSVNTSAVSALSGTLTVTMSGGAGSTRGVITSPAGGGTFASTSVTFTWSSGSASTGYYLYVGSTPGGTDYLNSGSLAAGVTSRSVTGLPNDARTVYARLWSLVSGAWVYDDYSYTASGTSPKAQMTSPVNGTTITSSTTFNWSAGGGATGYWLYVGSSAGGSSYHDSGSLGSSVVSRTVTGLPTNGSTVYVRLYSLVSGAWVYNDYTYTSSSGVSETVSTPTTPTGTASGASGTSYTYTTGGSTTSLSNPVQYQFDWGDGSNSGWLPVGTTSAAKTWSAGGTYSVRAQARSSVNTSAVSALSGTLTATMSGGAGSTRGVITSPASGATFASTSVTFTWSAGSASTGYYLYVGSTPGGTDYLNSGSLAAGVTSRSVTGLPNDARTVYARLWSLVSGAWVYDDYSYTASGTSPKAQMTSPATGSTISGSVTFNWSAGTATGYWLYIGTSMGGMDILNSGSIAAGTLSRTVSLPAGAKYVRLWSLVSGAWVYNDYTYN